MRKLKKLLAIVLTAALLLGITAVTASAAGAFADTEKHWAESSIERWAGHNIVQGGDNGLFDPNKKMTRAEFAVVLSQLLKLEDMGDASFTDVPKTAWYAKPMLTLANAGILAGFEDGTAAPYALISREQAFALLARALHIPDSTSTQKQPGVAFWAQGAINALRERGILKGTEDDNGVVQLAPKQEIDKASMMSLLDRTVTTYIDTPGTYENTTDNGVVLVVTDGNVSVTGTAAAVVVADAADGASVTLSGAAVSDGVTVSAPDVNLALSSSTVAGGVTVTEDAANANVQVYSGSTVDAVTTAADNVSVSGSGKVESVEVTGGDKVNVSTSGTEVKVDEAATGSTVTAGGSTVAPGQSTTTSGSSGGSSGGSTPVTPPAPPTPATTYTVTFDPANGTATSTETVESGAQVTVPADPTKTGYTFLGWSADGGTTKYKYNDKVTVTANVTYTAQWEAITYTVTFDVNAGSDDVANAPAPQTVNYGGKATLPAEPERAGYVFVGWQKNGETAGYDFDTVLTEDITLNAAWKWVPECGVLDLTASENADVFATKATGFKEAHYNKPNPSGTATSYDLDAADANWFFTIPFKAQAATVPTISSVTFNGTPLANEKVSVSVGNNRFAKGMLYSVDAEGLRIALPIVALEQPDGNGELVFTVNYQGFDPVTAKIKLPAFLGGGGTVASETANLSVASSGNDHTVTWESAPTADYHGWKDILKMTFTGISNTSTSEKNCYFTKRVKGDGTVAYGFTTNDDGHPYNTLRMYPPTSSCTMNYTATSLDRYGPVVFNFTFVNNH